MTQDPTDDPEYWQRVVKALLVISPFAFVGTYLLAAIQGATWNVSLLLAAIMFAGCLAAAGLFKVRGSRAAGDAVWLKLLLVLLKRR